MSTPVLQVLGITKPKGPSMTGSVADRSGLSLERSLCAADA
jgi:hypothetical protein